MFLRNRVRDFELHLAWVAQPTVNKILNLLQKLRRWCQKETKMMVRKKKMVSEIISTREKIPQFEACKSEKQSCVIFLLYLMKE